MTLTAAEAEQVAREGIAALQRGDATSARAAFERLSITGQAGTRIGLLLAQACRMLGDGAAEAAALDRLLDSEPKNIPALLMRGELHARGDDRRAATSFFQAALGAARAAGQLPPALAAQLDRAADYVRDSGQDYQTHLERSLAERVGDPRAAGPRFAEALDILVGRKSIQLQQPSIFYFPGLPHKAFYDAADFEWASEIEAATPAIRAEAAALLAEGAEFRPYVEQEKNRPRREFHGMHGDPSWGAFHLWQDGALVPDNAARCPRTVAALERVPMTRISRRTPAALFSLLRPGARIPPHHGMLNTRLICHLPLIVPPGCWLRVGNDRRFWEEGRLMIFDDSLEHEAMNPSDALRVVLLFDIWRPELDEAERRAVAAMFETIDAYGGVPADA